MFRKFSKVENDPGSWFTFGHDPESGKDVRFRVRRVPADLERQIVRQHLGTKKEVRFSGGQTIVKTDAEATFAARVARAVYALVESEGCGFVAGDADAAALYAGKADGLEIQAGQPVLLDGHWTEALKLQLFEDEPHLVDWIEERSNSLRIQAAEEAVELGKT